MFLNYWNKIKASPYIILINVFSLLILGLFSLFSISIIQEEVNPKPMLMSRYRLKENQAEAILELKLRQLAKLEEAKIKNEQQELSREMESIKKILKSSAPPRVSPMAIRDRTVRLSSWIPVGLVRNTGSSIHRIPISSSD